MSETLDQNYGRAGYHAKQTWGTRPALLLIDFTQAYYEPSSPLYGGEGCVKARAHAVELVKAARAAGTPIIFTGVSYQRGGADGGAFYAKVPALSCFDPGNPLARLVDELTVEEEDVLIMKQYPSAFFGTSLAAMLQFQKIDTLILCGLTTSGCVRATCVDSISSGFVTLVAKDACGDRADGPHEANLFDMSAKYADLLTTEEASAYMQSCVSA